jgi:hypothetical protein
MSACYLLSQDKEKALVISIDKASISCPVYRGELGAMFASLLVIATSYALLDKI